MGLLYPSHVKASHINFIPAFPPKPTTSPFTVAKLAVQYLLGWYTPEEKEGLKRTEWYTKSDSGYYQIQSTRPQTLGYSLADSPVGLLAWIYEKLHAWTDDYPWTDEEICDWVSVYWFSTAGPGASVNIYYESVHGDHKAIETVVKYNPVKLVGHMLCPLPRTLLAI